MKKNFEGYTSSEIGLLNRVAELARCFGLRPSDADATFDYVDDPEFECGVYILSFSNRPGPTGTEKGDKFDKMMDALGCRHGGIKEEHVDAMEDIVERAISLAPRVRSLR